LKLIKLLNNNKIIMRIPITLYKSHIILSKKDHKKLFWENSEQNIIFLWDKQRLPIQLIKTNTIKNINKTKIYLTQIDSNKINNTASELIIWPKWSIYLQNSILMPPPTLQISKSDAIHLKLYQNQKIKLAIPYKNIILESIKVKINDSSNLELFCMEDFCKKFGIINNDWCKKI